MTINNIKFHPSVTGNTSTNATIIEGGTEVGGESVVLSADVTAQQLAIETLNVLKKIEYHLSLMTDANLENCNL